MRHLRAQGTVRSQPWDALVFLKFRAIHYEVICIASHASSAGTFTKLILHAYIILTAEFTPLFYIATNTRNPDSGSLC